jgi:hypothetical protein
VNGTLQVEAAFSDRPTEYFKLYSAQLDNGYRHFIRVQRMKNQMTVNVNETISIKQEISSGVPIQAEKLYLGNLLILESGAANVSTTALSLGVAAPASTTTSVTTGTTSTTAAADVTAPPTTMLPALMLMTLLGGDTTLPSVDNTLAPVTTFVQPVGDADLLTTTAPPAAAAAVSLSRDTRQAVDNGAAAAAAAAVTSLFDDAAAQTTSGPNFFKGVIQDVQLSNGANVKRIVKLFELDFAEKVDVELSLGRVTAVAIKKGVVSDNTCRTNPCQNDGICHSKFLYLVDCN